MKISYNWLKSYINGTLPEPETLADILTFKLCEVEGIEKLSDGDTVLDLNILPNRAHDLLSHQGVAREVAGLLGFGYNDPTEMFKVPSTVPTALAIDIQNPNCRRYMGRVVRGIKVGPSPEWVVKHLESIGQRSINNIVDATNIVMFDCGAPCHAFDARTIPGEKIVIASAKEGEAFPVLGRDNVVAKLKATDMVIATSPQPSPAPGEEVTTLAIAGVKGGLQSGVVDDTTDIILEVANFAPVAMRKTARRLNLLSDSAKRFENDLSPEYAPYAMRELSALIFEMFPDATFEEIVDVYPVKQQSHTVPFQTTWINKYLGTAIAESDMVELLKKYGYEISGDTGSYVLNVPYLRLDLTGAHDIAEEVARLYGLEKIPVTPLALEKKNGIDDAFAKILAVKQKCIALGYRETLTYTFRKKGAYEVSHGVGDKSALRNNIADGLKEAYEANRLHAPLLGLTDVQLFEVGDVFPKEGETTHVALADKKGVVEMTLDEFIEKNNVVVDRTPMRAVTAEQKFVMWSHFPCITRDIAVWVPATVAADELQSLYQRLGTSLLARTPQLFDQFTKDGKTSFAFRLVFQSFEKTLTDEEIHPIMESIDRAIKEKGWEVR